MGNAAQTQAMYDETATRWVRTEPVSLSDFTGRPAVFDLCGDVSGLDILDLGCGEGYCARILKERGARSVFGIDLSDEMIACAKAQEEREPNGISYAQGSVVDHPLPAERFDLAVAVFLFNYVTVADMTAIMTKARAALRPGGSFVFAVPHPAFPFLNKGVPPFHVDASHTDYFAARDERLPGTIDRIDGASLNIEVYHKTFQDYMTALGAAGFSALPEIRELTAGADLVARDEKFFGPVHNVPLHMAVRIRA